MTSSRERIAGFREVAELADVSVSTVDRVLNERGSVSEARRRRVLDAARALDLRRVLPSAEHGTMRIELILPQNAARNSTPFWERLDGLARLARRDLPPGVVLHRTRVDESSLTDLRRAILTPAVRRNALLIAPVFSDEIADALQTVQRRGETVISLVSSAPHTQYAGVDNLAMGRTAAHLMAGCMHGEGDVLLLRVAQQRREQADRSAGFAQVLRGRRLHLHDTDEDDVTTRRVLLQVLAEHRVAGIYVTGHTPDVLSPVLRATERPPCWISHELSPAHMALMREGLMNFVLDQDPEAQLRRALHMAIQNSESAPPPARFRILCRENMET